MVEDTPATPCLRVNRLRLRELLSTKIPVQWDKQAFSVSESPDTVTVSFQDGTSATGSLLIGADGVWSAIRPHVLKQPNEAILEPFSSAVILGELQLSGEAMEKQLQMGHTGWVALGAGYTLFSGLNRVLVDENGVVKGDYYWVMGNLEHADVKGMTGEEKLAFALEKAGGLGEEFLVTIRGTKAEGVKDFVSDFRGEAVWGFLLTSMVQSWWDALIPGSKFPAVNRVLLIGDAAHPMTPSTYLLLCGVVSG